MMNTWDHEEIFVLFREDRRYVGKFLLTQNFHQLLVGTELISFEHILIGDVRVTL